MNTQLKKCLNILRLQLDADVIEAVNNLEILCSKNQGHPPALHKSLCRIHEEASIGNIDKAVAQLDDLLVTKNPQPDIQTIDDLNTFFSLLTSWHKGKVDTLNHMRDVPEGTAVTLNDETVPSITLTGDVLSGFKLGIDLSLMELGTLPFYPHVEDEASEA